MSTRHNIPELGLSFDKLNWVMLVMRQPDTAFEVGCHDYLGFLITKCDQSPDLGDDIRVFASSLHETK